jgi:hypothetical protein
VSVLDESDIARFVRTLDDSMLEWMLDTAWEDFAADLVLLAALVLTSLFILPQYWNPFAIAGYCLILFASGLKVMSDWDSYRFFLKESRRREGPK